MPEATTLLIQQGGHDMQRFDKLVIPEINNGQLIKIIRDKYQVDAIGYNKIQGLPFSAGEILDKILELTETN